MSAAEKLTKRSVVIMKRIQQRVFAGKMHPESMSTPANEVMLPEGHDPAAAWQWKQLRSSEFEKTLHENITLR